MRTTLIFALSLLLAGCVGSMPTSRQLMNEQAAACTAKGYTAGTQSYTDCLSDQAVRELMINNIPIVGTAHMLGWR